MDDIEFSSNDSVDKRNGWHPEYFEDEENFCDNLVEVIKLEFGPFEKKILYIHQLRTAGFKIIEV